MKMLIIAIGRLKAGPERDLCERYILRINGAKNPLLSEVQCLELPESRKKDVGSRLKEEAASISNALPNGVETLVLDESGEMTSSPDLSIWLGAQTTRAARRQMATLIGGADGLASVLRTKALRTISLSRMTFPRFLARVVVLEQFYRATTLTAGHPYHRF